jgi:hypothetical protein
VITAKFLVHDFDDGAAQKPLFGEKLAATVGGGFFEAGRLDQSELAKRFEHLREAFLQMAVEQNVALKGGHKGGMVTRDGSTGPPGASLAEARSEAKIIFNPGTKRL